MENSKVKTWIECQHLKYFIESECGKNFLENLQIQLIVKSEKPDFLLFADSECPYGLEVSTLDSLNKDNYLFQSLDSVVKKLFVKISQKLNRKYFINLICLEKNLNSIKFRSAELVEKLFKIIQDDDGKPANEKLTYTLGNISVSGQQKEARIETSNGLHFLMMYSINDQNFGGTPCFGQAIHNPIYEIQRLITKKNSSKKSYISCIQQFLMIVVDPFITKGCFFTFDDKLFEHKFISTFDAVFLLILGGRKNIEVIELKNAKK